MFKSLDVRVFPAPELPPYVAHRSDRQPGSEELGDQLLLGELVAGALADLGRNPELGLLHTWLHSEP